jgi:GT2 family glycosyltransferase
MTAPPPSAPLRIAVGIATRGRAAILAETLAELARQRRAPDRILVCHVTPGDVGTMPETHPVIAFLTATAAGLPRQRNVIIDAIGDDADVVLFLDDDFLPAPDYLAVLEQVMQARPDCVVATGHVLADGAKGPGITVEEGRAILARDPGAADPLATVPHFNGYGCNMAVRLAPIRAHGLRFDEALPLYAWYEDIDLTRRLAAASGGGAGAILRLAGARGVHLGVKSARTPGLRLGYSQVANPIYLASKGSFPWSHAVPSALRHCAINALRSLAPEPEVDRWGRFRGNLLALWDLLRGRGATPGRILEL